MKLNASIKIAGERVVLVPYRELHVQKYHLWMKSEELQLLTASQPLSLEQEYEMQESWRQDDDSMDNVLKCTFIILDRVKFEQQNDEIAAMIGDTNIFITDTATLTGEIEIMIAEKLARGKKLGWEAVILMFLYGIKEIGLKNFEAKISMQNTISIEMFHKLKFIEISRSEVFNEITLHKLVDEEWTEWLRKQCTYQIQPH